VLALRFSNAREVSSSTGLEPLGRARRRGSALALCEVGCACCRHRDRHDAKAFDRPLQTALDLLHRDRTHPIPVGEVRHARSLVYCSLGTNLCGLSCVHTESDGNNCGRCGVVCPGGSSCDQGACVCTDRAETVCDGVCVDTQTSSVHCGACDSPCPAGVVCVQGTCAVTCPAGEIACGSSCVDPLTTKEHCGLCNQICAGNLVCANGHCACPMGLTQCAGSCVELADGGICP
jgi:hypothetical protein